VVGPEAFGCKGVQYAAVGEHQEVQPVGSVP
jgi:hypothetical protein